MTWVAAAAAGVAIVGGVVQSNAAKKAAGAQGKAADASIAEQQRQYDLAREDQAPYRTIGTGALNQLASLYGLPQYTPASSGGYAGAQPVNNLAPVAPGGFGNSGTSAALNPWTVTSKLGGAGKILDPAGGLFGNLFGGGHGDENRNLKAFAAESGVMQLPNGMLALPDGSTFSPEQLPDIAGTWYGAMHAPDGNQQDWQSRYSTLLGGLQKTPAGQAGNAGGGLTSEGVPNTAPMQGGGTGAPGTPNYNAFFASPDYQFTLDQGQQALERSAAARGGLFSGNTGTALQQYGQGLASTQLNNYTNRLASLAGLGQTSVQSTGQIGFNTGQGVANSLVDAGNARASGVIGQGNALADALGTVGGAFGGYMQNRNQAPIGYFTPTVRRVGG